MRVKGRKAFIEDTLRITPSPCLAICAPKTWLGSKVPWKFKSNTERTESAGRSKKLCSALVVALG